MPHIVANLNAVGTPQPPLVALIKLLVDYQPGWQFDSTGRVDNPPSLKDVKQRRMAVCPSEVDRIRHLAFATTPFDMVSSTKVRALEEKLFKGKPSGFAEPFALITVGPPGSGKSRLLGTSFNRMQERLGCPSMGHFVRIDPDYWITELCQHDNRYRPLANFQNHMMLMRALSQRCCVLFDGTGKDPLNTCGRVISRMKQANFRVCLSVVLADFDCCMCRVKRREQDEGRGVPDSIVKATFRALQRSVPLYLQRHASLADCVYVYDNSSNNGEPALLHVLQQGSASAQLDLAIQQAKAILDLDPMVIARHFALTALKELRASRDKKKPAVLVFTGAFNPAHNGHIATVRAAKEHLEQRSDWIVMAGVLLPCSDERLAKKLEPMSEPSLRTQHRPISLKTRLDIINYMTAEEEGLLTLPVEECAQCSAAGRCPDSIAAVCSRVQEVVGGWAAAAGSADPPGVPEFTPFHIAGMDSLEEWIKRHGSWQAVEDFEQSQGTKNLHRLIVNRPGYPAPTEDPPPLWHLLTVPKNAAMSSTKCRKLIAQEKWVELASITVAADMIKELALQSALYQDLPERAALQQGEAGSRPSVVSRLPLGS